MDSIRNFFHKWIVPYQVEAAKSAKPQDVWNCQLGAEYLVSPDNSSPADQCAESMTKYSADGKTYATEDFEKKWSIFGLFKISQMYRSVVDGQPQYKSNKKERAA